MTSPLNIGSVTVGGDAPLGVAPGPGHRGGSVPASKPSSAALCHLRLQPTGVTRMDARSMANRWFTPRLRSRTQQ